MLHSPQDHIDCASPQRNGEQSSSGSHLLSSVLPVEIQAVDALAVKSMLAAVGDALALATSGRMRQLVLIASSRRRVCLFGCRVCSHANLPVWSGGVCGGAYAFFFLFFSFFSYSFSLILCLSLRYISTRRYLDRLVKDLERRAGQEDKLAASARESASKCQESKAALVDLGPRIAAVVSRTAAVKQQVEVALSQQFGGRRVNILGEINNALSSLV